MTDQQNTAPAVWDPTARGGAGGWVRGPQHPAGAAPAPEAAAAPQPPVSPQAPADPRPGPVSPPPGPGAVGDQGPPLGARPYLATAPGYDPPTAPFPRTAAPQPPAAPPTASPFPAHASPQQQTAPYQAPQPQTAPYQAAQEQDHGYPLQPPAAPPQPPYAAQPQPPYGAPPQPPYAAQPGYPADYPTAYEDEDDEDRPANRRTPLLIGFALLLVLAVGGGLLFAARGGGDKGGQAAPAPTAAPATGVGNPPPAPAPTGTDPTPSAPASPTGAPSPTATGAGPNAQSQAQALDGLLSEGENAKAPIGNAVAKVSSCPSKADIESSAQVFDNGANQRAALLTKLAQLSVTDVPGGADAVNSLKSAWQLSADIDKAYATWARAVAAQGCSGRAPTTQDKKHADELNPQATQAKTDFMTKWNPIANSYGLTPRTQDRI
ncbi:MULTISPECIES: hypothetical protein [Streptomyces]|uniref:hypothetical protein n=1 Tax=Streptomyces TaxID=1883 RepID=UPI0004C00770|nr:MULTISPECIES: hypothetical protein [Streptomyces]